MANTEQPAHKQWSDIFWGEQNAGFPALSRKLVHGAACSRELVAFFRARAALETNYAASLTQLSKTFSFKVETGPTACASLAAVHGSAEAVARSHRLFGQRLHDELAVQLDTIGTQQTALHDSLETEVAALLKSVAREAGNVDRLKKEYVSKCTALTRAIDVAAKGQTNDMTRRDYEKIQERVIKAKKEVDVAESEYHNAVDRCNAAHDDHERAIATYIARVETSERDRLVASKATLLAAVEAQTDLLVGATGATLSRVKETVLAVDCAADMDAYVLTYGTGATRPQRPKFQSQFKHGSVPSNATSPVNTRVNTAWPSTSKIPGSSADLDASSAGPMSPPLIPKSVLARTKSQMQLKQQKQSSNSNLNGSSSALSGAGALGGSGGSSDSLQRSADAAASTMPRVVKFKPPRSATSSQPNLTSVAPSSGTEAASLQTTAHLETAQAVAEPVALVVDPVKVMEEAALPKSVAEKLPDSGEVDDGNIIKSNAVSETSAAVADVEAKPAAISDDAPPYDLPPPPMTPNSDHQERRASISSPGSSSLSKSKRTSKRVSSHQAGDVSGRRRSSVAAVEPPSSSVSQPAVGTTPNDNNDNKAVSDGSGNDAVTPPNGADVVAVATAVLSSTSLPSGDNAASDKSGSSATTTAPQHTATRVFPPRTCTRRSIKMEGWLRVCDQQTPQQWSDRWCALEGGYLWVFDTPEDNQKPQGMNKPRSMISLAKSVVQLGVDTVAGWVLPSMQSAVEQRRPDLGLDHAITVTVASKRQIVLACATEMDQAEWLEHLSTLKKK